MISKIPYTLSVSTNFNTDVLLKNGWLIVLHSCRTPPHAGIIINGHYYSLTIKGQELNVKVEILLKTISQKKIETVAIQLIKQPVFSLDYQKEVIIHYIKQFPKVQAGKATCMSPVKLFLQEFYALNYLESELLYELIERLKQNKYIYQSVGFNLNKDNKETLISFPVYTNKNLQDIIDNESK